MPKKDWQQVRTYADHLGHRVVLEQCVGPDFFPDPDHLIPIQVYSLVALDDDHEQLRDYLMQSFWDDEVKPLFEIYSYCPTPSPVLSITALKSPAASSNTGQGSRIHPR
jgi:hypothetical protein